MLALRFDVRDVFRAPRLALSLQRMWIQLVGMSIGYIGYLIITYLSFLAGGVDFGSAWSKYGLLPCLFAAGETYPWYAWLTYALADVILLAAFLIANTAVARATYMQAKGNNFYSWREAYAFAFRKAGSVLMTPISLAVLIGLMVLGALVIGLLGKIPYVGELGISILTIFWFLAALLIFFVGIVTVISFLLVPSIIATTDEDAFEAVFQSFSITWGQAWRLFAYQIVSVALAVVSMGILAFGVKESITIMNKLLGAFMGGDYINLANNGQAMVQSWLLMGQNIVDTLYRSYAAKVYFARSFITIPASELPVTVVVSSYLFAISMLFIGGWVLSYGLSTFTVGNMLLYLILRKKKDGENLLERKDKEEEQEDEADKKQDDLEKGNETTSDQEKTDEQKAPNEGEQ
jgi:hypothetical protein